MAGDPEFDLSADEARRAGARRAGLRAPRPSGRVDARHLRRAIDDVGLLQLDSVNVFCRSHYMPVFSRLGPYPREALDRLAWHENPGGRSGGRGQRRADRVLGARGLAAAGRRCSRCCAGGWRGRTRWPGKAWRGWQRSSPSCSSWCSTWCASAGRSGPRTLAAKGRRRAAGRDVELERREDRARVPLLRRAGAARRAGSTSSASTTCPSGCCRAQVLEAPTPSQEEAQRAADPVRGAAAGGGDRGRPRRLLPAAPRRVEGPRRRAGRGRRPGPGRGRGLAPSPPTSRPSAPRAAPGRGGARPAHPVRLAGLGARAGPSGSSTSATGSRSTCRRPSASTATTSCPSCSATAWSPGSTSKATDRPACCGCAARSPSRASTPRRVAAELADGAVSAHRLAGARWRLGRAQRRPRGSIAQDAYSLTPE